MKDLSRIKILYETERKKLDQMLIDDSVGLTAGMAQSGYVIGIAAGYIESLEKALASKTEQD